MDYKKSILPRDAALTKRNAELKYLRKLFSNEFVLHMTHEQLEDVMDDLREIHATHCENWDANFICGCDIMTVMNKLYAAVERENR